MDLSLFLSMAFPLAVLLSISLYVLKLLIWKSIDTRDGNKQFPPGKTGLPIVGEGLELLRASKNGVPETFFFDRIQKYSSEIFRTSLLGETVTVMCGAASNKFIFSNEYKLVNEWWSPSMSKLFRTTPQSSSEQGSKKLRKLYTEFLKIELLQNYIGTMEMMIKEHLDTSWDNMDELTVHPLVKNFTFSLACRLLLSMDDQARIDKLLEYFTITIRGLFTWDIDLPGTPLNRAIKASNSIQKELMSIIQQRKQIHLSDENKASPSPTPTLPVPDMLSQMIQFSEQEGEDNMDLAEKILGLLLGGYDPVTSVLTVVIKYLAELPHIYNQVLMEQTEIARSKAPGELLNWNDLREMRYSWSVVCEAMRLVPPLQGAFKQAIADISYAGYFIPKGWKIYWSAISTHKNPKYFPNPEKFDPSRFEGDGPAPYTFIPFGGGPRICPGSDYARLTILTFMHHLVRRYKWEKLNPDDKKIIYNPFPIPEKGLQIRLQPHKNIKLN